MTKSRYELMKEVKELKEKLHKKEVSMPWQINVRAQTFNFEEKDNYDSKINDLVRAGITYFNVEKVSK